VLAAILTIGNELVSGDVGNSNGSWLAQRLEARGAKVVLIAAVPDELDRIVAFVRREAPLVDHLLVTGGLGGTPDDITRESIAAAFGVPQEVVTEVADDLRSRFTGDPDYVTGWAALPRGSRPLENPLGGAPGFLIENVWVLPGLPREMEAMFDRYADEFAGAPPIQAWRRLYRTRESVIAAALAAATRRWPEVLVGSYPSFPDTGPEVEADLRARFTGNPDYVAPWAALPEGSRSLENPLGGAPGFRIENTWVLPGLPSEMKAMFDRYAEELRAEAPIGSWRRRYRTRESVISPALVEATERWPGVLVGSYPHFGEDGPEVEVVLKSADTSALDEASRWLAEALDTLG